MPPPPALLHVAHAPAGPSGPGWPAAPPPRTVPYGLRVLAWRARPVLLAAALVAACALAARAAAPPPDPTTPVVVATDDLTAGHVVAAGDLRTVRLPAGLVPHGAATEAAAVLGTRLAVDVPRGLPLVDTQLAGSRFARAAPAGTVTVPVHLSDAAVTALLRPGDRVDLVAGGPDTAPDGAGPHVVAEAALVLEVRRTEASGEGGLGLLPAGAEAVDLVVVAVPPDAGHRIAAAATGSLGAVLVEGS